MKKEFNQQILSELKNTISELEVKDLDSILEDLHPADIAEYLTHLDLSDQKYLIEHLDNVIAAEVIKELDDDDSSELLQVLTPKVIAERVDEMNSDDAADIISELPLEKQSEVIEKLEDDFQTKVVELLAFDENSAGGLMEKEFIKVNWNWTVLEGMNEMRAQAEAVKRIHTIYVVDDKDKLVGTLSLKSFLYVNLNSKINEIVNTEVYSVNVYESAEDVASYMQKYDLFVVPVVDQLGKLLGRITVDDILDVVKDEADKDYQLASGISGDVDEEDSVFKLTKARLPWLAIGTIGGIGAASILDQFQATLFSHPSLILFVPLIQATAGNVGVQSSAIVVQSLANKTFKRKSTTKRLTKELMVGLTNAFILGLVIFLGSIALQVDLNIASTICSALMIVIVNSAVIGTLIPILLDKQKIDPAIATGPFITTCNDIVGILIYFLVAKLVLGL